MERISWIIEGLTSAGPSLAATCVFVLFALALAWLCGLRSPLLLIGAACPVAIAGLAIIAELAGLLGLSSSLIVDGAILAAVAAFIAVATLWWTRRTGASHQPVERPGPIVWAGAAIGAAVGLGVWAAGIGTFALPPQANDDIWHGYLIERLTTMPVVTATSVAPIFADAPVPVTYYPYGIHLAGALIHQATGAGVPEVVNGLWVVSVGLLLPFGVAALAWRLFPERPWVAFWASIFSVGVTAFPYITNGIMPYTVALAMVPGLVALVVSYVNERVDVPLLVIALAAVGVFVIHPAAAITAAILGGLVVIELLVRPGAVADRRASVVRIFLLASTAVVFSLPWLLTSSGEAVGTPGSHPVVDGWARGLSMAISLGTPWTPSQPVLAAMTLIGALSTLMLRRGIALTIGLTVFGAMFVGLIVGDPMFAAITRPWYGEWYRLVAVVGLLASILAALGLTELARFISSLATRLPVKRSAIGATAVAVLLGVLAVSTTAYDAARGQSIVRTAWHANGLVTAVDVQLFNDLSKHLTQDDKVLSSPRDGSTWMYAMFGATPVQPYVLSSTGEMSGLFSGQGSYQTDVGACQGLASLDATYAIAKNMVGYVNDYDIVGFIARHPDWFELLETLPTGSIYHINSQALSSCTGA